jgi:hypothetical protein
MRKNGTCYTALPAEKLAPGARPSYKRTRPDGPETRGLPLCLPMLHVCLLTPFPSPARQAQFEAVRAALAADATALPTLLLGNLPAPAGEVLDAVVLRPHSITLLLLEARGGHLAIRDFAHAAWQLDGGPLTGSADADNPFQQFSQQKQRLQELLRPHLDPEQANLNFITGLLLFGEPVVFGPEVEERMAAVPAAGSFHLLADPARFTRRLAQLASPEIALTAADLTQLAQELGATDEVPVQAAAVGEQEAPETTAASGFLRQKASQLWHWLGAHDVDDLDTPPYGYEEEAARRQEKQELEQLRATLQADVAAQLRALELREAEREESLTQLRQQLAAAPAVTSEAAALQARIAVESREKELLEAARQASRAESEVRNRELDAKIEHLSRLMQQMQDATAAATMAPQASAAFTGATATRPPANASAGRYTAQAAQRLLRQWGWRRPRPGIIVGAVFGLGLLVWAWRAATADLPRRFEQNGAWGLLHANGDTLVPARYASLSEFRDGRAVAERQGAFGVLNEKGEETVAPAYDAMNSYADGFARVRIGDLYTFVDEQGVEFNRYYFNALDFSEGHAAVLDHRGWFYIQGPAEETKAPVLFQEAYPFHEGLARVKQYGFYTFIDEQYLTTPGAETKPFGRYTDAGDFNDGRARVVQDGRTFYINKDGEPVQ